MNPGTDRNAWLGLGMASLVLGFIGLLLFFLPILGIPIAVVGLAIGIVGFVVALFSSWSSLRWSLGGIALCCLTLGVDLAIWFAPEGYIPRRSVPRMWQSVPHKPFVPPPASIFSDRAS